MGRKWVAALLSRKKEKKQQNQRHAEKSKHSKILSIFNFSRNCFSSSRMLKNIEHRTPMLLMIHTHTNMWNEYKYRSINLDMRLKLPNENSNSIFIPYSGQRQNKHTTEDVQKFKRREAAAEYPTRAFPHHLTLWHITFSFYLFASLSWQKVTCCICFWVFVLLYRMRCSVCVCVFFEFDGTHKWAQYDGCSIFELKRLLAYAYNHSNQVGFHVSLNGGEERGGFQLVFSFFFHELFHLLNGKYNDAQSLINI